MNKIEGLLKINDVEKTFLFGEYDYFSTLMANMFSVIEKEYRHVSVVFIKPEMIEEYKEMVGTNLSGVAEGIQRKSDGRIGTLWTADVFVSSDFGDEDEIVRVISSGRIDLGNIKMVNAISRTIDEDKELFKYYKPKIEEYLKKESKNTPENIKKEFKTVLNTLTGLDKISKDEIKAEEDFKKLTEELRLRKKRLTEQCSHVWIKYLTDPSGNNDCDYQCQICRSNSKKVWDLARSNKRNADF